MNPTNVPDNERGNLTMKMIIFAVGIFLMVGLVVDGSGKINAGIQAQQLAANAARAAANSLSGDAVARGGRTLDSYQAQTVASSMANVAGSSSKVSVVGDRVTVTVTTTYTPIFLQSIGIHTLAATGSSTARAISE